LARKGRTKLTWCRIHTCLLSLPFHCASNGLTAHLS
jgi:hypothetical protein